MNELEVSFFLYFLDKITIDYNDLLENADILGDQIGILEMKDLQHYKSL